MTRPAYIYKIENLVNGNCYIGSTVNYKSRWVSHRSSLRSGKHHSFILQKAWDKYGEQNFEFKVLLQCDKEDMIDYENRFMALQKYNVLRTAKECFVRGGWKHTEEFKQKQSARNKGKKLSAEHVEKVRLAQKGKKRSDSFRIKCRDRQLGKIPSKVTVSKLSKALSKFNAEKVNARNKIALSIYHAYDGTETIEALCLKANLGKTSFYNSIRDMGLSKPKRGAK